jgi:hypothetical protein
VSKKAFGELVPVLGGGIAPSGAEHRDIPLLQWIKRPIGRVTHLPMPMLKHVLRPIRQERPPKAICARVGQLTNSSSDVRDRVGRRPAAPVGVGFRDKSTVSELRFREDMIVPDSAPSPHLTDATRPDKCYGITC